jgi:hypothetical protein
MAHKPLFSISKPVFATRKEEIASPKEDSAPQQLLFSWRKENSAARKDVFG